MLCQFSFRNFRSYRDEAVFSMRATRMREFEGSLIPSGDKRSFLPVAAVYGPNAGGKSNLYYALEYVCHAVAAPIVLLTSGRVIGLEAGGVGRCSPFAFDPGTAGEPSWFEVCYRVGDHEYRYELEVNGTDVVYEALDRRKLGRSRTAKLFSREGSSVELGASLRRAGVSTGFNPMVPYLSFLRMNCKLDPIADAANWFVGCAFLNYSSAYLETALERVLDEGDSDEVASLLRSMGISIDGFRVEKTGDERRGNKVFVRHSVGDSAYELRLQDESAGTQKLMGLSKFVARSLASGTPLLVDELDAKLHPKLLGYVVQLFRDHSVNRHGAQLVFTSHDVSAMRNDILRRDEIWFAAKGEGEASRLWSLADVREPGGNLVSKNAAFGKQYLAGRYGADPRLIRMEGRVLADGQ